MTKKKGKTRSSGGDHPPAPPPSNEHPGALNATGKGLLLGIGVIALIHLATSFAPALRTWGIDYWSELPVSWRFVLMALVAACLSPVVGSAIDRAVETVFRARAARVAAVVAVALIFYVFRSRGYAYGDGYSFLNYFKDGTAPALVGQLKTQVLDLYLHWAVFRIAVMPLGGSVAQTYAILGAIGGALAILAIVRIAAALTPERGSRRLIVASSLSTGAVFLFFGHPESYTLTNVAFLWALAFALESRQRASLIWAAWGMWVLAVAFHQVAVAAFPVMVWAHWRRTSNRPLWTGKTKILMAFLGGFLAWLIATYIYRIGREPIFLPFTPSRDSAYSAFSVYHLVDVVNLLLFLAPMGIIVLVLWFVTEARERPRPTHLTIAIAAAATWYFTFWVDPLIGTFRDWDLFTGMAFPLSIWAGSALALRFVKGRAPEWLWVPVAALGIAHAGTFVATTQNEMAAAERVDRLVGQDVHYSAQFFNGSRLLPWAVVLRNELGRNDLALNHLHRFAEISPRQPMAWWNLCRSYRELGMLDSALAAVERAAALAPQTPMFLQTLLQLRYETGDAEGSRGMLEQIVAQSDTSYTPRCMLGVVYLQLGRLEDAQRVLETARQLHPDEPTAHYNLGLVAKARMDTSAAIGHMEASIQRGARGDEVFEELVQLYQGKGRLRAAIDLTTRWEQTSTMSATPAFLRGTSYFLNSQFDSARICIQWALSLAPGNAVMTYYLASTERNLGNPERARELALQAAQLDGGLALPYLELVYLAADANDREAAVKATKEYLARAPQDSNMAFLQQFIER